MGVELVRGVESVPLSFFCPCASIPTPESDESSGMDCKAVVKRRFANDSVDFNDGDSLGISKLKVPALKMDENEPVLEPAPALLPGPEPEPSTTELGLGFGVGWEPGSAAKMEGRSDWSRSTSIGASVPRRAAVGPDPESILNMGAVIKDRGMRRTDNEERAIKSNGRQKVPHQAEVHMR